MSAIPPVIATDRECLAAFSHRRDVETLRPIVERYLPLVYSSALRRTGEASHATEVTLAVFLVFARRTRRLRKKTVLAGWLFQITALVCKKLRLEGSRGWFSFRRQASGVLLPDAPLWTRIEPVIDGSLDRLFSKHRNTLLLCCFLNQSAACR